jgi:hypothetical protein
LNPRLTKERLSRNRRARMTETEKVTSSRIVLAKKNKELEGSQRKTTARISKGMLKNRSRATIIKVWMARRHPALKRGSEGEMNTLFNKGL